MRTSFYKGLIGNLENQKYHCVSFAQYLETRESKKYYIWHKVSNEILMNVEKCQGYSFFRFWIIKGELTRNRVKLVTPWTPPIQIRVKSLKNKSKLQKTLIREKKYICLPYFIWAYYFMFIPVNWSSKSFTNKFW